MKNLMGILILAMLLLFITHSIEEEKDKYRSNIIKDKKYNPKEPDFRKSILKMKEVGLWKILTKLTKKKPMRVEK